MRLLSLLSAICLLLCAVPATFGQEREWVLDTAGEDVFLVFGVAGTADVGVSFWCKLGSRKVSLFAPVSSAMKKRIPKKLSLGIGAKTYVLTAQAVEQTQIRTIEAKLEPQEEIINMLRREERFSMTVGTHKAIYPLGGADFDGLIKMCNADKTKPAY